MKRGVLFIAIGACGFSPHVPGAGDDAAPPIDAFVPQDVPDAQPGQQCFGSFAYDRICYADADVPTGPRPFMLAVTIDTDTVGVCDTHAILPPGNPCVLAAGSIQFKPTGQVRVVGSRPLVLLATESDGIVIEQGAVLDASSNPAQAGAGSFPQASCANTHDASAKGGSYGGSFVAPGGNGGNGNNDAGHGTPADTIPAPLTALHGGCPGGVGGGNGGPRSPGGGAIAVIAKTLTLDGLIAAAGAGGLAPATDNHGGNGGGAGGFVLLDAPVLLGGGEVDAKGGGGGEGKGGLPAVGGASGYNFVNRNEDSIGGSGDSTGGDGGHGGPLTDLTTHGADGGDGTSGAGGGGGGGAAGWILVTTANVPLILFAPPPH